MPLDDHLARKDWIGPRQDRWSDILPESWQTAINTSPTLNALARYMSRPSFEEGVKQWQDSIPGNSPIDRIADKKSTLAQEFPQPMNPLGQSLMETGGFLANFIGPGAKLPPAAAPKPQGIRAHHSSPHDFDKFDWTKIGGGEGNQAFGYGHYFAGDPKVRAIYDQSLARRGMWLDNEPLPRAPEYARRIGDAGERSIHELNAAVDGHRDAEAGTIAALRRAGLNEEQAVLANEDLYGAHGSRKSMPITLNYGPVKKLVEDGRLREATLRNKRYEVIINSSPDRMAHLDKPLSEQPPAVKEALSKILPPEQLGQPGLWDRYIKGVKPSDPRMMNIVQSAIARNESRALSEALRDAGVDGFIYKNGMTRGQLGEVAPSSHNYVVFDDRLIEILRKYGLLPPVAAGAAQALSQGQDTAY